MKHKDMPMANRTIRILNKIILMLEGINSIREISQYCKIIKNKIEEEIKVNLCENCEQEEVEHEGDWCDSCNLPERGFQ